MDRAAKNGHLEVVKWLHQNRAEGCTSHAMDSAAGHGHLDVVKWLHLNRTEGCTSDAMDSAASGGHLDVVKWLHRNRMEGCTARAMDKAAKYGHLEVVQWLHFNRQEGCTTRAVDYAAENGFLEIIKWLLENRSEGCSTHAMERAAVSGHLHVVQWLHDNCTDARICEAAFGNAASYGHFAVVTWLHKNGYEVYPGQTVEIAVDTGHFDVEFFTGLERDDDVSMANALSSGSVHNRGLLWEFLESMYARHSPAFVRSVRFVSEDVFDPDLRGKQSLAMARGQSVHISLSGATQSELVWVVPADTFGCFIRVQLESSSGAGMLGLEHVEVLGSSSEQYVGPRVRDVVCAEGMTVAICTPLSGRGELREKFQRAARADRASVGVLGQLETFHPFVREEESEARAEDAL
ncbi:hypothetical protein PF007_g25590, partial [Phytophthora fragariae]